MRNRGGFVLESKSGLCRRGVKNPGTRVGEGKTETERRKKGRAKRGRKKKGRGKIDHGPERL